MGGLFTTQKDQKQKSNNDQKRQQIEAKETDPPSVKSQFMVPTQSRGEQQSESQENISIEQTKQNSYIRKEQNIVDISKTGQLVKSSRRMLVSMQCYDCSSNIDETIVSMFCSHQFHQQCFAELIERQLQQGRHVIKCKCGTKINTNILRQIVNEGIKQKLLYGIFSKQLEIILKYANPNKLQDLQQIRELSKTNQDEADQIINLSNNKKIVQQIKEYTLDASGFLHINQSQLFMLSFCLFCCNEIDTVLVQVSCGHNYHQQCLLDWFQHQILNNQSLIVKCRCGSKLSTNVLRRIPQEEQRLKLLNYLFSNQLNSGLLNQLRKKNDYDQIMELFQLHKYTTDQDYQSTTGFLYFSNYSTPGGD